MAIFNNLVGGMPNIYMTPKLPATELKLPAASSMGTSGTKAAKKDGDDKDPDLLYGDTLAIRTLKDYISNQWSVIGSQVKTLVDKHNGNTSAVMKDPAWKTITDKSASIKNQENELVAAEVKGKTDKLDFDKTLINYRTKDLLDDYNTINIGGINYRVGKDSKGNAIYHGVLPGYTNPDIYKDDNGKVITNPTPGDYTFIKNRNVFENRQYNTGKYKGTPFETADYGWEYIKGDLGKTLQASFNAAAGKMNQTGLGGPTDVSPKSGYNFLLSKSGQTSNIANLNAAMNGVYEQLSDTEKKEALQEYYAWKSANPNDKVLDAKGKKIDANFTTWWSDKVLKYRNELTSTLGGELSASSLGKVKSALGGGGGSDVGSYWAQALGLGLLDDKGVSAYLSLPISTTDKSTIESKRAKAINATNIKAQEALKAAGLTMEDLTAEQIKAMNETIKSAGDIAAEDAFENTTFFKQYSKLAPKDIEGAINKNYTKYKNYYISKDAVKKLSPKGFPLSDLDSKIVTAQIQELVKTGEAIPSTTMSSIMTDPTNVKNYGVNIKHITMTSGKVSKEYQGTPITANEELFTDAGKKVTIGSGVAYHINPYEGVTGLVDNTYKVSGVTTQIGVMDEFGQEYTVNKNTEGITKIPTKDIYMTEPAIFGETLVTEEQYENMKKGDPLIEKRDATDIDRATAETGRGMTAGTIDKDKYNIVVKTVGKKVTQYLDIVYPGATEINLNRAQYENITQTGRENTANPKNIISKPK